MLVLTRRPDESLNFQIGGLSMTVSIVAVKGNQVRIGIDAPDSVKVLRGELIQLVTQMTVVLK